MMELGFADVADLLASRIEDLCGALQLQGSRQGIYYTPLNPVRADRRAGSFVVTTGGPKQGRWNDYAASHYGDALDLVAYVQFGGWPIRREGKREAFRWAKRWLGLSDAADRMTGGTDKLDRAREDALRRRADAERQAQQSLQGLRARAFMMWTKARTLAPNTPAWSYLNDARGIELDRLERMPSAVRWVPDARYVEGSGEPLILPALYTAMWFPDGKFAALHRTFLKPDGSWKADVKSPKKIWPRGFWGSFIPLARGHSGLGISAALDAGARDELCWCEGVEDGLTIALLAPEWRVHAVGVAGNFAEQTVPATTAAGIVSRDNDPNPAARKAVGEAVAKLQERCTDAGVKLFQARAKRGAKDFNDMIRARRDE